MFRFRLDYSVYNWALGCTGHMIIYFYLLSGVIKGKVLAPLSTEGTTADDVSELAENVRQVMLKVFHEQDHLDKERNETSSSNDKKTM